MKKTFLLFCVLIMMVGVPANAQIVPNDPMVRITSLRLGLNLNEIIPKVSDDVSKATGIDKSSVTYYWQYFEAIYCPASKDPKNPIIFVDLYVPGSMTDKQIGITMTSLADALAKHTGIAKEWVYIQTHFPKEGYVFIAGKIAVWDEIKSMDPIKVLPVQP